jgi:hypothetical protein
MAPASFASGGRAPPARTRFCRAGPRRFDPFDGAP